MILCLCINSPGYLRNTCVGNFRCLSECGTPFNFRTTLVASCYIFQIFCRSAFLTAFHLWLARSRWPIIERELHMNDNTHKPVQTYIVSNDFVSCLKSYTDISFKMYHFIHYWLLKDQYAPWFSSGWDESLPLALLSVLCHWGQMKSVDLLLYT